MTKFEQDVVVSAIYAAAGIASPQPGGVPRLSSQTV
jgi:hypothetical protein